MLTKTAEALRSYVKESQRARYVIPALAAATLLPAAYALAPRDSDSRINRLTDGLSLGYGQLKDQLGFMGNMGKTMWDTGTTDVNSMPLLDQVRLYANVYGMAGRDLFRQGRIGLRDFRAQLRDAGVPTGVGNTMDKGVGILSELFGG
jgi:hypothetical protein